METVPPAIRCRSPASWASSDQHSGTAVRPFRPLSSHSNRFFRSFMMLRDATFSGCQSCCAPLSSVSSLPNSDKASTPCGRWKTAASFSTMVLDIIVTCAEMSPAFKNGAANIGTVKRSAVQNVAWFACAVKPWKPV